jgi:hypothetical protein
LSKKWLAGCHTQESLEYKEPAERDEGLWKRVAVQLWQQEKS